MKRVKIIAVALAVGICFAAFGCYKRGETQATRSTTASETEAEEKETTKETTTEETTTESTTETTTEATTTTQETTTTEATTTQPQKDAPADGEKCSILLDLDFHKNIALAKYSIVIYLDDKKLDTLEHGNYYLETVSSSTGEHTLRFEKRGDPSIVATTSFKTKGDTTFKCDLITHMDKIEISDISVVDSLVDNNVEMPDVTELRLDKALEKLKDAGFINITTDSGRKTILLPSNWVVTKQNVKAGESVKKTTEIVLVCEKDG